MFKLPIIIMLTTLLFSCDTSKSKESVVYIDNIKVFEGFDMKKDYDKILESDMMVERTSLDSLQNRINYFETLNMIEEFNTAKNEYSFLQRQYSRRFQDLANNYTNQVNERLNELLKEFGDSLEYDFIFGTNGSGSIMYSRDTLNVTNEVIEFINKSYKK